MSSQQPLVSPSADGLDVNVFCIQKFHSMSTSPVQLVRLEAAPDLVDQVYRSLRDAISDGSIAPGARLTQ